MTAATHDLPTLVIPVDAEHGGLRVVVSAVFLAGWALGYVLLSQLVPGTTINVLALIGGFVLAYAVSALVERLLKRRWPSGRVVSLDADGVRTLRGGAVQQEIRVGSTDAVTALLWRFQTARRSRVPKGWHVLACALEQNERYLSVYTFVSPDQFKDMALADRFTLLTKRKTPGSGGRDDLLLAGEQRRLMLAEQQRWLEGAEMSIEDFKAYLARLDSQFPQWMR